jgi:dihydropteroate synthase
VGILNITPDSFYDGGRYDSLRAAVERARSMIEEGADVIEIGGEKAGPGEPVPVHEEIRRVVPVLSAIRAETGIPVAVDTRRAEVAEAVMASGADIINSIDGFGDRALRRVAAATGAAVVVMHIEGRPRVANPQPHYHDVVKEVRTWLLDRVGDCLADGIAADRIAIDPGPGFGKTSQHDLTILRRIDEYTELPYPVMLAASRKGVIGAVLGIGPEERLEGTLAVLAWGVLHGVKLVRVHDVRAATRTVRMAEAVVNPQLVEAGT